MFREYKPELRKQLIELTEELDDIINCSFNEIYYSGDISERWGNPNFYKFYDNDCEEESDFMDQYDEDFEDKYDDETKLEILNEITEEAVKVFKTFPVDRFNELLDKLESFGNPPTMVKSARK